MRAGLTASRADSVAFKVAVIVLHWNGRQDIVACLKALSHRENASVGFTVCDNASTEGSMQNPRSWLISDTSAFGAGSEGRPVGCREDYADSSGRPAEDRPPPRGRIDAISVVAPGCLTPMLRRLAEDRNIGMCGSTLVYTSQPTERNFGRIGLAVRNGKNPYG